MVVLGAMALSAALLLPSCSRVDRRWPNAIVERLAGNGFFLGKSKADIDGRFGSPFHRSPDKMDVFHYPLDPPHFYIMLAVRYENDMAVEVWVEGN